MAHGHLLIAAADLACGINLTAMQQDTNTVLVSFENAAPRRFDLVVGADGLHSVVCRLAFNSEPAALHPLDVLNAWFTVPAEVDLGDWYLMYNGPAAAASGAERT